MQAMETLVITKRTAMMNMMKEEGVMMRDMSEQCNGLLERQDDHVYGETRTQREAAALKKQSCSSNETSRPSSRTQSIDSRYHRNSTCSANSNLISSLIDKAAAAVVNGGSCGGGGGSNGSNSSKMRRKKILVPAVFDIPGIQISRIETIDLDDASDKSGQRTLELVVGGRSNKNKKDSTASISSVGSTTANHYHHNGRHYHQQNGSSSFSRKYIIVKSSDASSDYSRFSDYSLVEAMSRSRSSRSSRDSSNFSGSQKLYDMSSSPYNSQLDIDDNDEDDNENNEKNKKSHGRDYSLLTPSIPRKGSVVTFDVSDSNVRRHSSPVPSLRRKDLTEAGSRKLEEDEAAARQDNQRNQITEMSSMSTPPSTNQRYVTTSSHKPHLLTAARHKSSSQSQTRKRSCDQSLPTIFITPIATSGSTVSHEAAPTAEHLPMTSLRVSDSSLHSEQKISNTPEKEENNKKLEFETDVTNLNNSFNVHHHTVSNEDLCCEVTRDTGSTPTAPAPSISSPSSTKCSFGRKYGVWSPETDSHSCCFSMQHQQQPPTTFQQHRKPQQHCYRKSSLNLQFGQHETKPRTSQSIKKPARISYHSDIFPHLENVETSYTPTNFTAGADSGKMINIAQLKEKTSPRYSASSRSQSSKSLHRGLRKESAHVGRNFSVKQKNNNHNDDKKNDDAESKIGKHEG
ncbi:hypothetical protein HELRODRAFT_160516 [Helobdella robusta]|uniref:Uncharacterized protein n=1 Tax=Helobdella robusta TaxID=6412 RepID=T1EQC6_HELRO|nr:hypothetical protein HELRODRAFT_160516 [Helobdella robusta]ESO06350.1 hypothetical protein HELRODRAFT_160516 [Helobdella robusta]